MSEKRTWFDWLRNETGQGLKVKYIVILLVIGTFLMFSGPLLSSNDDESNQENLSVDIEGDEAVEVFGKSENENVAPETMGDYEKYYQKQLTNALEQVVGLSDVTVMVNVNETERDVYQKNVSEKIQNTEENDYEGGERNVEDSTIEEEVVIVRDGESEKPLIVKTEKPEIRGVLVVANGVENSQVKMWVVEAVSRVLDVPSHRISVLPKQQIEEES
ncbi:stage III sporulation protein AG [Texcoconibacillus texcoconensis]|uniref:Stage III sporulation protein AG n=1 Tax=Texcoconibacillus texcoconensis TaxID=1095777 RepID=A0A840QP22_9BACI|nr:stage III sporulation protein AG [Texcoconibacillus texcoconensis]